MLIRGNSASIGASRLCMSEVLLSPCLDVEWCYLFPLSLHSLEFFIHFVHLFIYLFIFAARPDDGFAKRLFTRECRALKSCQKAH